MNIPSLHIKIPSRTDIIYQNQVQHKQNFIDIIEEILNLKSMILVQYSGKLYKCNIQQNGDKLQISLGTSLQTIDKIKEIPRGQSGSLIDEIKIGKEYYIRKNMPSNIQDWGSFKRELIAMKLFQGELHVLVPKY